MTIELTHTTGANPRSVALRTAMDRETYAMYESEFAAMDEQTLQRVSLALATNQDELTHVVIASEDGVDLGHAALRALADGGFEVKKVFVHPFARGRGLSRILMATIEDAARARGESRIVLQTGPKQVEAISLYAAIGYEPIDAFAPYVGLDDMVFFGKALR